MQICVRPNTSDFFENYAFPELILNDEYGHRIKDISKVTFRTIENNLCIVEIEYPKKDNKTEHIEIKSRTFFLRSCRIDLASIGLTKKQEKFHASLEPACKCVTPWYVRVAMKVVRDFLKKEENIS